MYVCINGYITMYVKSNFMYERVYYVYYEAMKYSILSDLSEKQLG